MSRMHAANDDGSTLLLIIFYGFLALSLVLVALSATSLYLDHKRLLSLADGAVLAGSEAFTLDAVQVGVVGPRPLLRSGDVSAAVDEYLALVPHASFEDLVVTSAASVDGLSASVTLRSWWRPPVLTLVVPDGVPLEVTVVSRAVFH
ncbi:pilus assembly protein TadG-related protein [Cryobacterium sp. Y11]|uniref:pilus assembly protein TadG-related protein n=1 Tax=Cryobacterium sp. Y11 TaxID=2045016 RepID=UPI000CE32097|nr:pilus assembly protein TadG-related protein [Cryobacterium sp. Y11]